MIEYVIWDFNGTILDDVDVCLDCLNQLLITRDLYPISKEKYKHVFTFPIMNYYKALGLVKTEEDYKKIAPIWLENYVRQEPTMKAYPYAEVCMKELQRRGIKQVILSACEQSQLERMMNQINLSSYMDAIIGLDNIYAASKIERGLAFIKDHSIDQSKAVLIGDTLHDKEVADTLGIPVILCADGHQAYDVLVSSGANEVIKSLDELFNSVYFL